MKKNVIKFLLDLIMVIVLVLLYNSHAISIAFHEIAGLFIFGLFIIHCLLNKKWISGITIRLFNKSLSHRVRFGYIINFLLFISFLLIVISGICISKVLFHFEVSKDIPWRNVHYFFSAISIILMGIHIGLHWSFVSKMFKNIIWYPKGLVKGLSMFLLLVVLSFGFYSISTSNFTRWLTTPFIVEENTSYTNEHAPQKGENKNSGDIESKPQRVEVGAESIKGDLNQNGHMKEKPEESDPLAVVRIIATYLSIIGVFTAITYYLDKLMCNSKNRVDNDYS